MHRFQSVRMDGHPLASTKMEITHGTELQNGIHQINVNISRAAPGPIGRQWRSTEGAKLEKNRIPIYLHGPIDTVVVSVPSHRPREHVTICHFASTLLRSPHAVDDTWDILIACNLPPLITNCMGRTTEKDAVNYIRVSRRNICMHQIAISMQSNPNSNSTKLNQIQTKSNKNRNTLKFKSQFNQIQFSIKSNPNPNSSSNSIETKFKFNQIQIQI